MSHGPARLLALFGPAAVFAAWGWSAGLWSADTPDPSETTPPVADGTVGAALTERVQAGAKVVVLGNSQAASAVDVPALAGRFGIQPKQVAVATLGGAKSPTVYAMLKHRVLTGPKYPTLILVPMSLTHLLDVAPPAGNQRKTFLDQLTGPDEVLDAKVFGKAPTLRGFDDKLAALQARRDTQLSQLTAAPLVLAGAEDPARRMERARNGVFGEVAGQNFVLNVRTMPLGDSPAAAAASPAVNSASDLDRTLLPDMIEAAKASGAQIVFVTVPQQLRALASRPDDVRALASWLGEHGAGFLHLEGLSIPSDGWVDEGHVNPRGRAVFSAALLEGLAAMNAFGGGDLKPLAAPPPAAVATRTGAPPAPVLKGWETTSNPCVVKVPIDAPRQLSDHWSWPRDLGHASPLRLTARGVELEPHVIVDPGTGCVGGFFHAVDHVMVALPDAGVTLADLSARWDDRAPHERRLNKKESLVQDAWWIPADGGLDLRWSPIALSAGSRVQILLSELSVASGTPTVDLGAGPQPLTAWDRLWMAELPVTPDAEGGLTLRFASPDNGPHLAIRAVVLLGDGPAQTLIGDASWRPDRIPLATGNSVTTSPPLPSDALALPVRRDGNKLIFTTEPPLAWITEPLLRAAAGDLRFGQCLPVHARSGDAEPVIGRQLTAGEITVDLSGKPGDWSLFPLVKRTCKRHTWVQPGETVTFDVKGTRRLHVDAEQVTLHAAAFPAEGSLASAPLTLKLTMGEVVLLDTTLPPDKLDGQAITLDLLRPAPPWPDNMLLTVTGPPDVWSVVGLTELHPAAEPDAAWFTAAPPVVEPDAEPPAPSAPDTEPRLRLTDLIGPKGQSLATSGIQPLPPATTTLGTAPTDAGTALRLGSTLDDGRAMACLPDFPSPPSDGPLWVEVTFQPDPQVPPGPGVVVLDARWVDAKRRAHLTDDGKPTVDAERTKDAGAEPVTMHVLTESPGPGYGSVRTCVRIQSGPPVLIRDWRILPTRAPTTP